MAAAAMESRAFPAFIYDPSAGPNWAARFCLQANSQVELDWPVKGFAYEDEQHQSVSQDLAFTVVDFLAADQRYAGHLARVPREKWNGSMIPVDESLAQGSQGLARQGSQRADGRWREQAAEGHRGPEPDQAGEPLQGNVAQPAGARGVHNSHAAEPCSRASRKSGRSERSKRPRPLRPVRPSLLRRRP